MDKIAKEIAAIKQRIEKTQVQLERLKQQLDDELDQSPSRRKSRKPPAKKKKR